MEIAELTFPVPLGAFTAYQEAGLDRELNENEREALAAWLPIINLSYEEGRENDGAALRKRLDLMAGFLSESEANSVIVQLLKSCRRWIAYAWTRGREEATQ